MKETILLCGVLILSQHAFRKIVGEANNESLFPALFDARSNMSGVGARHWYEILEGSYVTFPQVCSPQEDRHVSLRDIRLTDRLVACWNCLFDSLLLNSNQIDGLERRENTESKNNDDAMEGFLHGDRPKVFGLLETYKALLKPLMKWSQFQQSCHRKDTGEPLLFKGDQQLAHLALTRLNGHLQKTSETLRRGEGQYIESGSSVPWSWLHQLYYPFCRALLKHSTKSLDPLNNHFSDFPSVEGTTRRLRFPRSSSSESSEEQALRKLIGYFRCQPYRLGRVLDDEERKILSQIFLAKMKRLLNEIDSKHPSYSRLQRDIEQATTSELVPPALPHLKRSERLPYNSGEFELSPLIQVRGFNIIASNGNQSESYAMETATPLSVSKTETHPSVPALIEEFISSEEDSRRRAKEKYLQKMRSRKRKKVPTRTSRYTVSQDADAAESIAKLHPLDESKHRRITGDRELVHSLEDEIDVIESRNRDAVEMISNDGWSNAYPGWSEGAYVKRKSRTKRFKEPGNRDDTAQDTDSISSLPSLQGQSPEFIAASPEAMAIVQSSPVPLTEIEKYIGTQQPNDLDRILPPRLMHENDPLVIEQLLRHEAAPMTTSTSLRSFQNLFGDRNRSGVRRKSSLGHDQTREFLSEVHVG